MLLLELEPQQVLDLAQVPRFLFLPEQVQVQQLLQEPVPEPALDLAQEQEREPE